MDIVVKKTLLKIATGSLFLKIANVVLNFLISVLLARVLGVEGYGEYAFIFSVISLLAIPVHLGVPNLLVREVARYQFLEDWCLLRGIVRFANYFSIILSFLVGIISVSILYFLFGLEQTTQALTFYFSLILLPLLALNRVREAILQGFGSVILAQIPEKLVLPSIFFLLILFFGFFFHLKAYEAMGLYCLSAFIALILGSYFLYKLISVRVLGCYPKYKTLVWLKSIVPLALMSGFNVLNGQVDIFMLGIFAEKADVALYRVAFSWAALVVFALTAGNSVVAPYVSRLCAAEDIDGLKEIMHKSAVINFSISLVIVVIILFFGENMLRFLYGSEYCNASGAMIILALSQLVNAATGSANTALIMMGYEKNALYSLIACCVVNILLNYILIPIFGVSGAALATGISIMFINTLLVLTLWIKSGVVSFIFK